MEPDGLVLRGLEERDLESLNAIYNHYVAMSPATFDLEPVTLEARRAWFHGLDPDGKHQGVVAVVDGVVIGFAYSGRLRPKPAYSTSVETTVYVHPEWRGRSVAARLYGFLLPRLEGLGLHRVYAGIVLPNPASVALHERFGFRLVGFFDEVGHKFGRYWSISWMEKRFANADPPESS